MSMSAAKAKEGGVTMTTWTRSTTPTGVPVYTQGDYRIVARMSRSRIVGSAMVFGQWVHENDHTSKPEGWDLFHDERLVRGFRRLTDAKRYVR